ncbi:MAG: BatA and WFA domain-containing protein, partial [Pirellulales bacterium]|nr:BatA and WFA domain-containing protein [Pirellulales bacterium]
MFVHPFLFAIGIAAAALPLVVHWMTRPKPVRMPLSTIRLVSDALHQRRARHRLRDFLVLLFRCLAVALLAMAMARPLLVHDQRPSGGEEAERVKVVLLDASQSMAAIDGAATRFDAARAIAASELSYKPKLVANLLIASHSAGAVFDAPSANLRLLRQRLADAEVTAAGFRAASVMEEASRQLASSPADAAGELVIISDFQRSSWAQADFSALPRDTQIRLVSVAGDSTPANLA